MQNVEPTGPHVKKICKGVTPKAFPSSQNVDTGAASAKSIDDWSVRPNDTNTKVEATPVNMTS
jgi:hypothetical protein